MASSRAALAQSAAFRAAALRSEVRRAYIVGCLSVLLLVLVLQAGVARQLHPRLVLAGSIGVGVLLGLQGLTLGLAWRARRCGATIPLWFIAAMVALESSIPTGILLANLKIRAV